MELLADAANAGAVYSFEGPVSKLLISDQAMKKRPVPSTTLSWTSRRRLYTMSHILIFHLNVLYCVPHDQVEGWLSADSDSDASDEDDDLSDADANSDADGPGLRMRVQKSRPEYAELAGLGLVTRPTGCSLGVHEGLQSWRSMAPGSPHYCRTWGGTTGRSPRQALLRVVVLMLQFYCSVNGDDKLAARQLRRAEAEWAKQPGLL